MNNFNKPIHIWIGIIILLTFTFLMVGFLVWQFKLFEKKLKIKEVKFLKTETQREINIGSEEIGEEIIPAHVVKDYEKLKEFIIKNKFFKGQDWGLEYDPYLEAYFQVSI